MSKVFTVYGATGQQGGALIKYLIEHPRFSKTFKVRGVTRDIEKPSAKKLAEQGVEMVKADIDNPESLKVANQGSYAVFAVTNWLEKMDAAAEVIQGKSLADAAVAAKVELLIWSSLPRVGFPQFDSKAEVEDYIRTLPIASVFFMAGFFMQNHLEHSRPKKTEKDGAPHWVLEPPVPIITSKMWLPYIDIADIGMFLQPALDNPEKFNGVNLTASQAYYTLEELCETWKKKTGTEVEFVGPLGESPDDESIYYGPGGRKAMEWTLSQMEEIPSTWESFVERSGPWFE